MEGDSVSLRPGGSAHSGITSMSKLGGFFARKAGLYDRADETAQRTEVAPPPAAGPMEAEPAAGSALELDEDLLNALGAQIGGENELLRNLLLDANAKADELDAVKAAVARLVEPVSKALRAFETERSEKAGLQTVLNNTRTAYGKLRNEVADIEKRAASAEKDSEDLRRNLAAAQDAVRTAEAAKAQAIVEAAARKAQVADLESRLAQETGETKLLREENRRQSERLAAADKRIVAVEADLTAARQRLLMIEDEKRAQQAALDKASTEAARVSRKLAEMEAAFIAAQGRLRHAETNYAEANGESARLRTALDEAN
jgi:chromosome segregation ATPase